MARRKTVYFCPIFLTAPDIDQPDQRRKLENRFRRDWPSVVEDEIVISGLGAGWRGRRRVGSTAVYAPLRSGRRLALNTVLVYAVHAIHLALLLPRRRVIVLAGTPEAAFVPALARRVCRRRLRLVVRVEGPASGKSPAGSRQFRVKRRIECISLSACDLAVPMGDYTRRFAIDSGVPEDRIAVLPFPLAVSGVRATPLGGEPTVFFAGRLEREKGVHHLVAAFARVRAAVPNARLVIAGDGPLRSTLERLVEQLGLAGSVTFTGWLAAGEMAQRYEECYVFCLPSIWAEGLGMVLVEAAMAGRPVVASSLGGMLDALDDGVTGIAVAPGDEHALASAIISLLQDPDRAARMGLAGRERAERYLSGYEPALEQVQQRIAQLHFS